MLNNYQSMCEANQKKIVSSENGKKHIANNIDWQAVRQYKIDGCVILDGVKCDFLVLNDDKRTAYFIELKGKDVSHAIEQLESTLQKLKPYLDGYKFHLRIVLSRVTTDFVQNKFIRYLKEKKKQGISLKHQCNKYEEDI